MADVVPKLRITDQRPWLRPETPVRFRRFSDSNAHCLAPASFPPRISARCTQRTPVRCRLSPPPMCIRQELSPAVQTSAPVFSTQPHLVRQHGGRNLGILHRERSAEAAALLGSPADRSTQSAHAFSSRIGLSPTCSERSEWQRSVKRHAMRIERARRRLRRACRPAARRIQKRAAAALRLPL